MKFSTFPFHWYVVLPWRSWSLRRKVRVGRQYRPGPPPSWTPPPRPPSGSTPQCWSGPQPPVHAYRLSVIKNSWFVPIQILIIRKQKTWLRSCTHCTKKNRYKYSQKWNCSTFFFPISTCSHVQYLWAIYVFPRSVRLFCCFAFAHR